MAIKERWKRFKPLPEDIREKVSNLAPLFEGEGVLLAYLFGSLVRGEGDDIDLAVLVNKDDLSNLRERIWEALGTQRLDLVNLNVA